MRTKKSAAMQFMEELTGGPLTLGRVMLAIREGEEESQVEFARRLGISRSHLCDIEKDRKPVSPARAAEFARTLGYSETQFVRLAIQAQLKRAGLKMNVHIESAQA
jgi:transcriptional regulator with XRE-family HTH domain